MASIPALVPDTPSQLPDTPGIMSIKGLNWTLTAIVEQMFETIFIFGLSTLNQSNNFLKRIAVTLNGCQKVEREVYWLKAEAVSHTYAMDIKLENRAFQNKSQSIEQVMKYIAEPYSRAYIENTFSERRTLGGFT